MSRSIVSFGLALVCLLAGAASAQPGIAPSNPDRLGVYSTADCASDNIDGYGSQFTVYCVLTGTSTADVQAFEFSLRDDPAGLIFQTGVVLGDASWISFAAFPEFLVGGPGVVYPGPSQEVLLVSVSYLVMNDLPVHLYLEPIFTQPPVIPGEMAHYDSSSYPHAMYPVSGDHALPVFGFNTGPVWYNPGEIVIDDQTDGVVPGWMLFGPGGFEYFGYGDHTFTEMTPGDYSLDWALLNLWTRPSPNPVEFTLDPGGIVVVEGEYLPLPEILAVEDVPNDQGRQVRLRWARNPYDSAAWAVRTTEYGVYRLQDEGKLAGWDYVGSVPARGDDEYQFVAPTLCDSTVSGGLCESVFMVSAMTDDPLVYFDSQPDTGYSVDNLRPVTPTGFRVYFGAGENVLSWDAPSETDVDHYLVYLTASADVPPTAGDEPLAQVHDIIYIDPDGGWGKVYWVVAIDHAGNRSAPTVWGNAEVTGVGAPARRPVLHAAAPNPFNPSTTIAFELPRRCAVRLLVFDVSGHRVRTLLDGESVAEGRHQIVWHGRDDVGRRVSSGTYFYMLAVEDHAETRRMLLVK